MSNRQPLHRRSIRLQGYDYSQEGLYFITICCVHRHHLFGEIEGGTMLQNTFGEIAHKQWLATEQVRDNIRLHECIIMPNHVHGIIEIVFQKESNKHLGAFNSPSQTIGSIIRGYKIATIKEIKEVINSIGETKKKGEEDSQGDCKVDSKVDSKGELQFAPTRIAPTAQTELIKSLHYKIWQRNYYEHIIRNEKAFTNISNYIINNPSKWKEDQFHL